MKKKTVTQILMMFLFSVHTHAESHKHIHNPSSEVARNAHEGVFEDKDVKDRSLNDWHGVWQSVNPYLLNGDLDVVLQHKAESKGDKTADEYRQYYSKGYNSNILMIRIMNTTMEFYSPDKVTSCDYDYSGYKILTYKSGKKGVRYLFTCDDNNSKAPKVIQFSDHIIEPTQSEHFHIYMGNDSHETLLREMDNWPTFYPAFMSKTDIIHEMLGHETHGAHEHGVAHLNLSVEEKNVEIELTGALANFLSFEHKPENEAQIKEVRDMATRMHAAEKLFLLPTAAHCQLNQVVLKSEVLNARLLQSDGQAEQNVEMSQTKEQNRKKSHANLDVDVTFTCQNPEKLNKIDIALFKFFPSLQKIEVQMVTPEKQGAAQLSPTSTTVAW